MVAPLVETSIHFPSNRSSALIGLVVSGALLAAAARMTPDPRGHGSHEQLGLPPCGMIAAWRWPCPTCGMCTSFAYGVRGRFLSAIHTQPAGFALFVVTVLGGAACLHTLITGKPRRWPIPPWSMTSWILLSASVLLWGWGYKCLVVVTSGLNH